MRHSIISAAVACLALLGTALPSSAEKPLIGFFAWKPETDRTGNIILGIATANATERTSVKSIQVMIQVERKMTDGTHFRWSILRAKTYRKPIIRVDQTYFPVTTEAEPGTNNYRVRVRVTYQNGKTDTKFSPPMELTRT